MPSPPPTSMLFLRMLTPKHACMVVCLARRGLNAPLHPAHIGGDDVPDAPRAHETLLALISTQGKPGINQKHRIVNQS